MKELLAIVLLILSFSCNQLAFAQVDCFSTGRCRGSWTVGDYGCEYTYTCYDAQHLSCAPVYNHCCYKEVGYCNDTGTNFTFRQCFLDQCNY
jgi:hypothetical protein